MPTALYQLCVDALDAAGWPHSAPNDQETLGTQLLLGASMIGGSLRVIDGTVVRFLAFGGTYLPEDIEPLGAGIESRRPALERLLGRLNPLLDVGHFEHDETLGVVCRTGADLGGFVLDGVVSDPAAGRAVVTALVARATHQFAEQQALVEAVIEGTDPDDAFARAAAVTH